MKSIIFNTEMVKAILDGRKTEFRIPIKLKDNSLVCTGYIFSSTDRKRNSCYSFGKNKECDMEYIKSKYKVDDILYVKETFNLSGEEWGIANPLNIEYRADNTKSSHKWFSSNIMRMEYSRIFLKVTNVRVEKIQDISLEDMLKEGINHKKSYNYGDIVKTYTQVKREFINNWNSTAKDRYKWEDNPYVFVYELERINKED